jgi:hypothetical protein
MQARFVTRALKVALLSAAGLVAVGLVVVGFIANLAWTLSGPSQLPVLLNKDKNRTAKFESIDDNPVVSPLAEAVEDPGSATSGRMS